MFLFWTVCRFPSLPSDRREGTSGLQLFDFYFKIIQGPYISMNFNFDPAAGQAQQIGNLSARKAFNPHPIFLRQLSPRAFVMHFEKFKVC